MKIIRHMYVKQMKKRKRVENIKKTNKIKDFDDFLFIFLKNASPIGSHFFSFFACLNPTDIQCVFVGFYA